MAFPTRVDLKRLKNKRAGGGSNLAGPKNIKKKQKKTNGIFYMLFFY